jgi:hypothetical protein
VTVLSLDSQIVGSSFDQLSQTCTYTYQHSDGSRYTVRIPVSELDKAGPNRVNRRNHVGRMIVNHIQSSPPDDTCQTSIQALPTRSQPTISARPSQMLSLSPKDSRQAATTPVERRARASTDTGADDAANSGRVRGPDGKFLKKDEGRRRGRRFSQGGEAGEDSPTRPRKRLPPTPRSRRRTGRRPTRTNSRRRRLRRRPSCSTASSRWRRTTPARRRTLPNFRKEYGRIDEMFAPHRDVMRSKGFTPASLVEAWANVEQKLAAGPDSAIEVIKGLIGGYNIPVAKIAAALGVTRRRRGAAAGAGADRGRERSAGRAAARRCCRASSLREQVGQFGQKFQTIEQRERRPPGREKSRKAKAIQNTVNQFKSAVDDKGSLLHPHFDEVED